MKDEYNKGYQEKDYEKLPDLSEQTTKKSRSVLKVVLICLSVLLVVSLVYDNIVKPYIEKKKAEIEKIISTSSDDDDESSVDNEDDITSIEDDDDDDYDYDIIDVQPTSTKPVTSGKVDANPSSNPSQPVVEPIEVNAESPLPSQPQTIMDNSPKRTHAKSEDYSGLSTSEILDRQTHAMVVKQAQQAGVSTKGSTSEILDRITHANVVEQARQLGVSTKGSTSEILDRITHANVVEQARQLGVSTKGSTSEILDRITRKNLENNGY